MLLVTMGICHNCQLFVNNFDQCSCLPILWQFTRNSERNFSLSSKPIFCPVHDSFSFHYHTLATCLPLSLPLPRHLDLQISSRLAPLGRKGHSATVAPLCDESHVFIFGGAPRGRLGLSNALYSIELLRLSSGEGIWKRHRPGGAVPPARQGHSFTVVGGGRRLVLYGGVGESGDLLNDVQVLCIYLRVLPSSQLECMEYRRICKLQQFFSRSTYMRVFASCVLLRWRGSIPYLDPEGFNY